MAVPKQRHTKSRRQKRRMHIFLKQNALRPCPKCGALILPHTVCPNCGYYKNREVLNILGKLEKKERKKREKEMQEKRKEEKEKPITIEELSKKKL